MTHFTKAYIQFFTELKKNNTREWFADNKKRYEQDVKAPFEVFVQDLIAVAAKIDKEIAIESKDAIYRIHKDVRFSKDKTPYKLNSAAIISKFGRKNNEYPGFYIQLGADGLWIGGGAYMPTKEQLLDIRQEIKHEPEKLNKILKEKNFVSHFEVIQGEVNKILPADFKAVAKDYPFISNKQFYYMAELPVKEMLRDDLLSLCNSYFKAGTPLNNYLVKAMYH